MSGNDQGYGVRLTGDASGIKGAFSDAAQATAGFTEKVKQAGEATSATVKQTSEAVDQLTAKVKESGSATTAAVKQSEDTAKQLGQSFTQSGTAAQAAMARTEMSAKQVAAAMRMVPAQMTDIVTGLIDGQSPMTVLFQQGGQLKDMFGGVGNAAKALATYLFNTTTAVVGVAAGIGTLLYQANQGDEQIKRFNQTLDLTGGYAGLTQARFESMASTLSSQVKSSISSTRDALTALVSTGQFQGAALDQAALATMRLAKLTSSSATEIIADFKGMQSGVAQWAEEHNRQYHFLTTAQYQHIAALEQEGKTEQAATETLKALNDHLAGQHQNLGAIDTILQRVKTGWEGWVEALRTFGQDTTADRLTHAYGELAKLLADKQKWKVDFGGMPSPQLDADIQKWNAVIADLNKKKNDDAAAAQKKADEDRIQQEGNTAARELDLLTRKYDRQKAMAKALADFQRDIDKVQAAGGTVPSQAEQDKIKKDIREQFRDPKDKEAEAERYRAGIAVMEGLQAREQDSLKAHLAQIDALQQQRVISEDDAIKRRLAAQQQAIDVEIQYMETEAAVARKFGKTGDAERYDQEADRLRAQRTEAETQAQNQLAQLQAQRTHALQDWMQQQKDALDQQAFEASLVGKTADEVARLTRNRQIDLEVRNATRNSDGTLKVDQGTEDAYKAAGESAKKVDDPRTAWKSGDWMDGAKQGMKEYAAQAKTSAEMAKDAFTSMADHSSNALANFVTTGKFSFKDFARSLIDDLAQIAAKQMVVWAIQTALGYANGGSVSGAQASAKGNVFGATGLRPFSLGGQFGTVLDRPTFFAFSQGGQTARGLAGESGDEGIFPLKRTRDGRLGVQGSGGSNVIVNVYAADGTKAKTSQKSDGNNTIIDVIFDAVDTRLAQNMASGNGNLTAAVENTYGLNRAALSG